MPVIFWAVILVPAFIGFIGYWFAQRAPVGSFVFILLQIIAGLLVALTVTIAYRYEPHTATRLEYLLMAIAGGLGGSFLSLLARTFLFPD